MTTSIKTIKSVIADRPEFKTLINAVISRVGKDSISDINNHGISGGFSGFIYYSDTHSFAMRHRKDIVRLLNEQANDFGEEVVKMVSGFGVFRSNPMDNEDRQELYKYLGGAKCEQSAITNLMAWYAAEEVCHWFED
ncbi:MAG TPA: hypothetical protein VK625_00165 [Flavitalea sp.]|nr:hypothetical protein [Flavitalea sp.]